MCSGLPFSLCPLLNFLGAPVLHLQHLYAFCIFLLDCNLKADTVSWGREAGKIAIAFVNVFRVQQLPLVDDYHDAEL